MAAFDLQGAVQQARTGAVPADWSLYPLKTSSAWTSLAVLVVMAVLGVGASIYTLSTALTTGQVWAPSILFALVPDSGTIFILIGEVIVLLGIGIYCAVAAFPALFTALDPSKHFLLITPQGFAQVNGNKVKGAAFTAVLGMARSNNGTLSVKVRGRKPLSIAIGSFGKSTELYALLASARRAALQPTPENR